MHPYLHAKINFITHFVLKILQRNSRLVIFGNLRMPGHIHFKWRNFWRLSAAKKSNSFFTFSLRYCKDIANLLFLLIWACLALRTLLTCRKLCVHPRAKNQLHFPSFSGDTAKIRKLILGNLSIPGYAHPKW